MTIKTTTTIVRVSSTPQEHQKGGNTILQITENIMPTPCAPLYQITIMLK